MKAKLIKTEKGFGLVSADKTQAIASTINPNDSLKLSLKNCQTIENGYDLDELAKEKYPYEKTEIFSCFELDCKQEGFIEGAKTILEILGDKKFNKEDVRKTFVDAFQKCYEVINSGKFDDITSAIEWLTQTNADNYIQSLQQTEWDVSFNPEEKNSEGCLILKRL